MVNYECLKGLEPAEFFRWFGAVSRIPRGSGKEAGFVKLSMETESADAEEAARIALELKGVMDAQDIPFSSMSLYLWGGGDMTVQELPCREIFEEGMKERIQSYIQP